MTTFRQRIPSFVDTDNKPENYNFNSSKELLELEVIKRYIPKEGDYKFVSGYDGYSNTLMIITKDGFKWWVVGYISEPVDYLPKWSGGKYKVKMPDGSIEIIERDRFYSSCGDVVTLTDGTKTTNLLY